MPLNLTEEQIIQLAPDAASVKAGKLYFYKGVGTPRRALLQEQVLTPEQFLPALHPNLQEGTRPQNC